MAMEAFSLHGVIQEPMKTRSRVIEELVAEINEAIGQPYFKVEYYDVSMTYELMATEQSGRSHKYDYILAEPMTRPKIFAYLNGVLLGMRLGKDLKK